MNEMTKIIIIHIILAFKDNFENQNNIWNV